MSVWSNFRLARLLAMSKYTEVEEYMPPDLRVMHIGCITPGTAPVILRTLDRCPEEQWMSSPESGLLKWNLCSNIIRRLDCECPIWSSVLPRLRHTSLWIWGHPFHSGQAKMVSSPCPFPARGQSALPIVIGAQCHCPITSAPFCESENPDDHKSGFEHNL
jgi:hypothetical protein